MIFTAKAAFAPGGICHGVNAKLKLRPYKPGCPKPQTGHHLIPGRCLKGKPGYSHDKAPVICVLGKNQHTGSHKRCHLKFDPVEYRHHKQGKKIKYSTARKAAVDSAGQALTPRKDKLSPKEKACVKAQLDAYYKKKPPAGPGCTENTDLNTSGARGKALPPSVKRGTGP